MTSPSLKHETGAPGQPQRDGMGREVGGGFGMGDTCTPVADSCQSMAKSTILESNYPPIKKLLKNKFFF